ncbi:MAG: hypothetical protein HZA31_07015 [Opitutae bacterium]|nr:hypothetical protein [Opitutae bacterium]
MKRPHLTLLATALLALGVTGAYAQAPAATPKPPLPAVKETPVEVSGPTKRVSSTLSSAIAAGLPRYAPPPKEPPKPIATSTSETEEEEAIPEDKPLGPDQPKNKIIRLPRYIVEGDRPPIFRERDIYTKQALAKVAVKRYLSKLDTSVLNRYSIPFVGQSASERAMAMYAEDERLQNMSDLRGAASDAAKAGDRAGAEYIMRETNSTYQRSGGMDWNNWSK